MTRGHNIVADGRTGAHHLHPGGEEGKKKGRPGERKEARKEGRKERKKKREGRKEKKKKVFSPAIVFCFYTLIY